MRQLDIVRRLIETNEVVTHRMMREAGVDYTGRNRISNLRRQEGYVIAQRNGQTVEENAYSLVSRPGHTPDLFLVQKLAAEGWTVYPEKRRKAA